MKISKLFHWLYAFLMLLPVFFIGGRCLYVTFNKNAKDSYYGETINETEYSNVNSLNNLVVGNKYRLIPQTLSANGDLTVSENRIYFNDISFDGNSTLDFSQANQVALFTNNLTTVNFYFYNNGTYLFNIQGSNVNYFEIQFTQYTQESNKLENLISNYQIIFNISYNKYSYLDNAFIYSVNSLNDTPLFSWAKTSFLVAPFSYISGLFGIESTSPINTMLSYWLAISIIWLVFDLIMYVPLLVHRWIDKAKLE